MTGVLRDSRSFATDLYRVSQSERQKGLLRSMSGTDAAISGDTVISRLGTKSSRSSPFKSSRVSSSALEHRRMLEFPKMAAAGMQGSLSISWHIGASMALSGVFPFSKMDSSSGEAGGSCSIVLTSSPSSFSSSSSSFSSRSSSLQDGLWEAKTCSSLSFSFSRSFISVWRADFSSSSWSVSWGEEGQNQKKEDLAWEWSMKTLLHCGALKSSPLGSCYLYMSYRNIQCMCCLSSYLQLAVCLSAPSVCYDTSLQQSCSSPSWSFSSPPPLWKAKNQSEKKPILNAHPANFCHISSWLFSTIPLAKKRETERGGAGKKKKKSSLQCMLGILICSVAVQTLFSSGVKMLHHWHGLVEHVNAHFFFPLFFNAICHSIHKQRCAPVTPGVITRSTN